MTYETKECTFLVLTFLKMGIVQQSPLLMHKQILFDQAHILETDREIWFK